MGSKQGTTAAVRRSECGSETLNVETPPTTAQAGAARQIGEEVQEKEKPTSQQRCELSETAHYKDSCNAR